LEETARGRRGKGGKHSYWHDGTMEGGSLPVKNRKNLLERVEKIRILAGRFKKEKKKRDRNAVSGFSQYRAARGTAQ